MLRKHYIGNYLEELGKITGNTKTYGIRNSDTSHLTAMLDYIPSNKKQVCLSTKSR
jgi:hypothetical protein